MKKTAIVLLALLGVFAGKSFSAVLSGGSITGIQVASNETFAIYIQYSAQPNVGATCAKSGWYYVYRSDMVSGLPMSTTAYTTLLNFAVTAYTNKLPVNVYSSSTSCPLEAVPAQVAHFSSIAVR
ncbi:MAG: hypothetical protein JF616_01060 [Fibrobacteres bacterium]|jgi:hypothetical protein|nr:hypothetical protein [Fibrobacterota bacterium]